MPLREEDIKPITATPEWQLARELADPRVGKTEREHYAARRIADLEERIGWLTMRGTDELPRNDFEGNRICEELTGEALAEYLRAQRRSERARAEMAEKRVAELEAMLNTKYWEGIKADNAALKERVEKAERERDEALEDARAARRERDEAIRTREEMDTEAQHRAEQYCREKREAERERDEALEECRQCRADIRRLVEVRDEALAEVERLKGEAPQ